MDRYTDNVSPEPTIATTTTLPIEAVNSSQLLTSCYKTPDAYQHAFQGSYAQQIGQFYPTPPSDNEDSNLSSSTASYHMLPPYVHMSSLTPLSSNPNLLNQHNFYSSSLSSAISTQPLDACHSNNTSDIVACDESSTVNRQLSYKEIEASASNIENDKQERLKEIESIFAPTSSSALSEEKKNSSRYKRRSRTCYTKHQLDTLEATFQRANYPDIRTVDDLSDMLNLSTERISIWFQNRRARHKKAKKLVAKENRCADLMTKPEFIMPSVVNPSTYHSAYPASSFPNQRSTSSTTNASTTTLTPTNPYPAISTATYSNANDQSSPTSSTSSPSSYMPASAHTPAFYTPQFYQYPQFYQTSNLYSQGYSNSYLPPSATSSSLTTST